MRELQLTELISEQDIKNRIQEIGSELTAQFKNKPVVTVCVLKGAFIFYSDLIRSIDVDLSCEFFGVSSYHGNTSSSGEVKLTLDLAHAIENKHLLLVEDIVDTGLTMNYLKTTLGARKPASITTASLLLKPAALKAPCELDYVGFEIENEFVVGYGLDYQGYYRNLPYIAKVENLQ